MTGGVDDVACPQRHRTVIGRETELEAGVDGRDLGALQPTAGFAYRFQHELAELLAADGASAADVQDGLDIWCVGGEGAADQRRIGQHVHAGWGGLPVGRVRRTVGGAAGAVEADQALGVGAVATVEVGEERRVVRTSCDQRVATARHRDAVAGGGGDVLHARDTVVGERGHHWMRPPVAVIFAGLRRRQAHRIAGIDEDYVADAVADEIIRDGDADLAGTDHRDLGHQAFRRPAPRRRRRGPG
jgi:hypothetical protein